MRLDIGSAVFAKDGEIGHVERVIVDPTTNEVTHLVVNTGGLSPRQVVLEGGHVVAYRTRGIHVALQTEDVAGLPDFIERDFLVPPDEWVPPADYPAAAALWPIAGQVYTPVPIEERRNVPQPSIDLFEGMDVECADGPIGSIDEIVLDPRTRRIQAIVVTSGLLAPESTIIPVGPDVLVTASRVVLPCAKAELKDFVASRRGTTETRLG